jgi:hypothetical protein
MDVWTTGAKVEGYDEMRDFSRRMAAKIDWTPGGQTAPGLTELAKQLQKLDGVPLLQVMRIGLGVPAGMPAQPVQNAAVTRPAVQQPSGPSAEEAVYQGTTRALTTGALGGNAMKAGMVAGSFSGLAGFGRKKKQQQAEQAAAPAPVATPAAAPVAAPAVAQMEITTETKGFSTAGVDEAAFEIPAGFEQVKK